MEKSYFLSMSFNNIVFKGRNKAYGAYSLRNGYSKHMLIASTVATALFSGALVGPLVDAVFFADPVAYKAPTFTVYEPVKIDLPLPPAPKPDKAAAIPPAPKEKQESATEKFTEPKVVNEQTEAREEVPDQAQLAKANIGTQKIEGPLPDVPAMMLEDEPPTGIENGTGGETPAPPTEYLHVEQMPEFKGGADALSAYLSRKLRYPAPAQKNGVEGTVVVTFIVGVNGDITDVEVLKGLGYGTEEEAARVIASMPEWKPGRQNGRAVPVRYTLPIRFSLR